MAKMKRSYAEKKVLSFKESITFQRKYCIIKEVLC